MNTPSPFAEVQRLQDQQREGWVEEKKPLPATPRTDAACSTGGKKYALVASNFARALEIELAEKDALCAKYEDVLQYVAQHGKDRPISRVVQVCEMALAGVDLAQVTRNTVVAEKDAKIAEQAAQIVALREALPATLNRVFVRGWMRGHENTVEGTFIPILAEDEATFFEIDVKELTEDGSLPELHTSLSASAPKVVSIEDVRPLVEAITNAYITLAGDEHALLCGEQILAVRNAFTTKHPL